MGFLKSFDAGSLLVIVTTFTLFALALFAQGFTHDLLIESGVFLVSVKLIIMAYKSNILKESMERKLDAIHAAILQLDQLDQLDRTPPCAPTEDQGTATGR